MKASHAYLIAWLLLVALLVGFFVYLATQTGSAPTVRTDPAVVPIDTKKPPPKTDKTPHKPPPDRRRDRPQPPQPPRPTTLEGVVHGPDGAVVGGARVAIFA